MWSAKYGSLCHRSVKWETTEENEKNLHLFFACSVILFFSLTHAASAEGETLTVAVEITAPCVMHSGDIYTGFDIELWEEIAKELEWPFTYHETEFEGYLCRIY
jgi:ABC-type amino acid transport substrate-binding protein